MQTDEKVNLARKMCDGRYGEYPKYNYIYPFSNENIAAYDKIFDFQDKSYLTIGSSADQPFNAILNGCRDITVLDICPFTEEYFYLKLAVLEIMSRKKFMNFFGYKTYNSLLLKNMQTLNDIIFLRAIGNLKTLNYKAYYFWERIFKENKGLSIRKHLFNRDELSSKTLINTNRYLMNDENYNKLRRLIRDSRVSFINQDIFKYRSSATYDNINLSNLATCYGFDDFMGLFETLSGNLADDGSMLVSYLYDTDYDDNSNKKIYDKNVIKEFPQGTRLIDIPGVNGYSVNDSRSKDSIIVYKKVKKG